MLFQMGRSEPWEQQQKKQEGKQEGKKKERRRAQGKLLYNTHCNSMVHHNTVEQIKIYK